MAKAQFESLGRVAVPASSSDSSTGVSTGFHSIFRGQFGESSSKRQKREVSEAGPATLLTMELYIYLISYTTLGHCDVCNILSGIMGKVDWEMLALMDEARDLRTPNTYDAEDNTEEEDAWTAIRFLAPERISESFGDLMRRLKDMGFKYETMIRKQFGRGIWAVSWYQRPYPIKQQPLPEIVSVPGLDYEEELGPPGARMVLGIGEDSDGEDDEHYEHHENHEDHKDDWDEREIAEALEMSLMEIF